MGVCLVRCPLRCLRFVVLQWLPAIILMLSRLFTSPVPTRLRPTFGRRNGIQFMVRRRF
ncbi:hypothetical protein BDV30DRAFT_216056 [Aspergillus minisclerotigenes]|uniref:Uncharacterized protein n=1 Tax=Aspergillus minisclerotigenes TaxID=656917 RepID=A0A5N6IUB5_9EURO|nr:hypothetical protein BDV30DRAFT_216056 [Aspergillus minisclerotigenes]